MPKTKKYTIDVTTTVVTTYTVHAVNPTTAGMGLLEQLSAGEPGEAVVTKTVIGSAKVVDG